MLGKLPSPASPFRTQRIWAYPIRSGLNEFRRGVWSVLKAVTRVAKVKRSYVAPTEPERDAKRELPSRANKEYWIYAYRKAGSYPEHTDRGGKWLIFAPTESVDEIWERISLAVERGELGESAKVSTAKPNPDAADPSKHVICVYTYDSDDAADVRRIRAVLRGLGMRHRIPYKTDRATERGEYRKAGHKRVSKYYE